MKLKLCLLLLIILPLFVSAQSPWTPGKKGHYHQLSFTTIPSHNILYGGDDGFQLERFVTDNTLQYYGEIGLGDRAAVTIVLPFRMIKSGELATDSTIAISEAGNLNALGDLQVAGKYQIIKNDNFILTGHLLVGVPTAKTQENTGLRSGFQALQLSPSLSIGMGKQRFYTYGFLGYNYYSKGFASTFNAGAEFGWKFNKGFILALHLATVFVLTDGDNVPTAQNLGTGLYLNGQEYTAFQLKVMKEFTKQKFGLFASLGGGVGTFVPQAPAITFGAYTKF